MKQNIEQKGGEQKKENVVGKVVGTFFGGDYKEFKRRVETSFESNEFIPGSGAFLRSIFEQTRLNTVEFNECQKAIRIEMGIIKKEKKKAQLDMEEGTNNIEKTTEKIDGIKSITETERQDKIITDEIRARIMQGALKKENESKKIYEELGIKDPGNPNS